MLSLGNRILSSRANILQSIIDRSKFIITVKTNNTGTSNNDQFTIPIDGGTFYYDIETSDGQEIAGNTGSTTITFPSAGTYTIKISGQFPNIFFNDGGDKLKLMTIEQWGTQEWSGNMNFYGCANLTGTYTDNPNFSSLTTMYNLFRGCALFNSKVNFDTSNVTDMSYMFFNCSVFNQDISTFNTSKVTTMRAMFASCTNFNQDLSHFDTSKVILLISFMSNCTSFDQDISSFQIPLVEFASNMLMGVTLSTTNYDALLISWASQTVQPNVPFNGGGSKYSVGAATTARDVLTGATNLWTIADGGQDV